MNQKIKLLESVLAPSLFSSVLIGGLVLLASLGTFIRYGVNTNGIFALVLGPGSSPELINNTHQTFSSLYAGVFSNPTLNRILFVIFWLLIGLIVYVLVMLIGQSVSKVGLNTRVARYANINSKQFLQRLAIRFGMRLAVILGTFLYSVLFLRIILPFSLLNIQIGAGALPSLSGFGYGLGGILLLSISLHPYVVLLRLLLLRTRVLETN